MPQGYDDVSSVTVETTMQKQRYRINFDQPKAFELRNIRPLAGVTGLYFIFTHSIWISYPFKKSRLIYIGMSEKRTNSIGTRLTGHFDGQSRNVGLFNYRKVDKLLFTYINFEMLKSLWTQRIEDLESYFILDFVRNNGVYPICNNRTGLEVLKKDTSVDLEIDWGYFEGGI
jgi:hypothetical protein